ncbi:MAG: hypothetical protein HZB41_08925 [Ignavibacteriae bacterium]|nr:hypothetical protein [Ignavibacteriota bacterium]
MKTKFEIFEDIICKSLLVIDNNKNQIPIGFRSGFLGKYFEDFHFLTVIHKFNVDDEIMSIANFESFEKLGFYAYPIKSGFNWKVFYTKEYEFENFNINTFENKILNAEPVDFYHAKVGFQDELIQPEVKISDYLIKKQKKRIINLNNLSSITSDKNFGFYGYKCSIDGIRIDNEGLLVFPVVFDYEDNDYYYFKTNITKAKIGDYEGLSGSPILDEEGNLVAIFTGYFQNTNTVFGFKASKAIEFIKQSLVL